MAHMATEEYGLKKHFNAETARFLGQKIQQVHASFDVDDYVQEVAQGVTGKELKDRVLLMAHGLRSRLPSDYPQAVNVLVSILGEDLDTGQGMFNDGWYLMPVARFVEEFGLEHPHVSLAALAEITRRHTAEYAMRPFIERHYELAMHTLQQWAQHPVAHVRRAASECSRPRLPWARTLSMFVADPRLTLPILEALRSDSSEYVRKSVANHLNDISKDAPDLALSTAQRWIVESPTPETRWIVKHGLRTLIKQGNLQALRIIGATGGEHIRVTHLSIAPQTVVLGETVLIQTTLHNTDTHPHRVTVDYVLHLVRKNGKTTPKVFKLTHFELQPGEHRSLEKRHAFKLIQTRSYYPGVHILEIQVNGHIRGRDQLTLRQT